MGRLSERIEANIYRVHHKGRLRWRVQAVAPDGRRRQQWVHDVVEARRVRARWLAGLGDPRTLARADEPIATVADGLRLYEMDLRRRGKPIERAAQLDGVLARVWPEFLAMPISAVTVDGLVEFRARREREGIRANTIIRDLRVLRAMLKKARPEFVLPVAAMPAEDLTRVRWMTPGDEALVFTLLAEPFRSLARVAALTLMRQGELRTLRRASVHLHQGLVLLPRAKGGPRPVFLNVEAQELLEAQLARHQSDLVFPAPHGRAYSSVHVSRVWKRAARQAGLVDFHFHDLRHHGATVALSAGATTKHLKALGGWKSDKLVDRYAHVLDPSLRAIAEAMSRGVQTP